VFSSDDGGLDAVGATRSALIAADSGLKLAVAFGSDKPPDCRRHHSFFERHENEI
jgi:hypothetical protein